MIEPLNIVLAIFEGFQISKYKSELNTYLKQ